MSCDQCCESLALSLRQADITSEAALQFDVGLVFVMRCSLHTSDNWLYCDETQPPVRALTARFSSSGLAPQFYGIQ